MTKPIPVSLVHDFLELAEETIARDQGRPRQVSLRRAVSDAYYALFHAVCFVCADELVGWRRPWDYVEPIYRSLDHGEVRKRVGGDTVRTLGQDVARIGAILIELQDRRHEADYAPRPFSLNKAGTAALVSQAREAVRLIEDLPAPIRLRLAVVLVKAPQSVTSQ